MAEKELMHQLENDPLHAQAPDKPISEHPMLGMVYCIDQEYP